MNYKCEKLCYWKQCHNTADSIALKLNLNKKGYSVAFQSRLGKTPWIEPDLSSLLSSLAKDGTKTVLIVPVSFPVDCIETIHELNETATNHFVEKGGTSFEISPALNNSEKWIDMIIDLAK